MSKPLRTSEGPFAVNLVDGFTALFDATSSLMSDWAANRPESQQMINAIGDARESLMKMGVITKHSARAILKANVIPIGDEVLGELCERVVADAAINYYPHKVRESIGRRFREMMEDRVND